MMTIGYKNIVLDFALIIAGILLVSPPLSFAEMIVNGECDFYDKVMREAPDSVWGLGYCLELSGTEHIVTEDTIVKEPTRYSIAAFENASEAQAHFMELKRMAVEQKVGIGGSSWDKIAPEDIRIGETGFLEIAKNSPRYIGSETIISDTDNPEEGYYDQYIFEAVFLQGSCVVDFLRADTDNFTEARRENHYEQYYRTPGGELRYKLINTHPAADHSLKDETRKMLFGVAQRLANHIATKCGGATLAGTSAKPAEEPRDERPQTPTIKIQEPFPYEACINRCSQWGESIGRHCETFSPYSQFGGKSARQACMESRSRGLNACWNQCKQDYRDPPITISLAPGQEPFIIKLDVTTSKFDVPDEQNDKIEQKIGKSATEIIERAPILDGRNTDFLLDKYELKGSGAPIGIDKTAYTVVLHSPDVTGANGHAYSYRIQTEPVETRPPQPVEFEEGMTFQIEPGTEIYTAHSPMMGPLMETRFAAMSELTKIGFPQTILPEDMDKPVILLHYGALELKSFEPPQRTPLGPIKIITGLAEVESDETHFWVAHDGEKNYSTIGVYEGSVRVRHRSTGETIALRPQEDGTPGIVLLLGVDVDKEKIGAWVWIVIIILIGAAGYFAYRNRGKLIAIFRK